MRRAKWTRQWRSSSYTWGTESLSSWTFPERRVKDKNGSNYRVEQIKRMCTLSKMESGWQVVTILGFIFLRSAKCFSILPAGREANKKRTSSHQKTLKNRGARCLWWQGYAELKTGRCLKVCRSNKTSQIPVPCSILKIYNGSLERISEQVSSLGDTVYSHVKHLLKVTGLTENCMLNSKSLANPLLSLSSEFWVRQEIRRSTFRETASGGNTYRYTSIKGFPTIMARSLPNMLHVSHTCTHAHTQALRGVLMTNTELWKWSQRSTNILT